MIAALMLLAALAVVRAWFADHPWMVAAWAALVAVSLIGIGVRRPIATRVPATVDIQQIFASKFGFLGIRLVPASDARFEFPGARVSGAREKSDTGLWGWFDRQTSPTVSVKIRYPI